MPPQYSITQPYTLHMLHFVGQVRRTSIMLRHQFLREAVVAVRASVACRSETPAPFKFCLLQPLLLLLLLLFDKYAALPVDDEGSDRAFEIDDLAASDFCFCSKQ